MSRLRRFLAADDGQNLVEFALLLPVLLYILMGIMQFGLIFAAYITINNATREGARWGSIYIYNSATGQNQSTNDTSRQDGMLDRIVTARGILNLPNRGSTTANFDANGSPASWTSVAASNCAVSDGTTTAVKRGDLTICYSRPTGVTANDARRGYYMEVTAWYHQAVFVPLLDTFLPDDPDKGSSSTQFIRLPGRVTVVIN